MCVTLICDAMMIGVDVYRIVYSFCLFFMQKDYKAEPPPSNTIPLLLLIHPHIGPTLSPIIIYK